jgi:hypothetical protein
MTDAPFPARALRHIETDIGLRFGGGNQHMTFAERRWQHASEMLAVLKEQHPGQIIGDQPTQQMIRDAAILAIGEMLDEILARIG